MDAEGYNFGPDTLPSTEESRWVSYVYRNPAAEVMGSDHTGEVESKHAWVDGHDRLVFGWSWYHHEGGSPSVVKSTERPCPQRERRLPGRPSL